MYGTTLKDREHVVTSALCEGGGHGDDGFNGNVSSVTTRIATASCCRATSVNFQCDEPGVLLEVDLLNDPRSRAAYPESSREVVDATNVMVETHCLRYGAIGGEDLIEIVRRTEQSIAEETGEFCEL